MTITCYNHVLHITSYNYTIVSIAYALTRVEEVSCFCLGAAMWANTRVVCCVSKTEREREREFQRQRLTGWRQPHQQKEKIRKECFHDTTSRNLPSRVPERLPQFASVWVWFALTLPPLSFCQALPGTLFLSLFSIPYYTRTHSVDNLFGG